ncbi:MAG: hypothetical protein COB02_06665 [Candidatus Cloacimonadota bacterium]|nr:MAG: hypothetical protein COB02_06665 [Candidatus Cloacimonadota bacterium]
MNEEEVILENKMDQLEKGAYWFGFVGTVSIEIGISIFLVGMIFLAKGFHVSDYDSNLRTLLTFYGPLAQSIHIIIYTIIFIGGGWLSLRIRDVLEVVRLLILEMREVV